MFKKTIFTVLATLFLMQGASYADIIIPTDMITPPPALQEENKVDNKADNKVIHLLLIVGIPVGGVGVISLLLIKRLKH